MNIRYMMYVIVYLCFLYVHSVGATFTVQGISVERCKQLSVDVEKKMQRKKMVHALCSTAAAVYTLYSLKEFLSGNGSIGTYSIQLLRSSSTDQTLTGFAWCKNNFYNSVYAIMQCCAHYLCAQWIVKWLTPDFSVQSCIKKYGTYKKTVAKIESLLMQSNINQLDESVLFMVQVYMQKMICDNAQIMAYLMARAHHDNGSYDTVISFVTTLCASIDHALEEYQKTYTNNPVMACKKLTAVLAQLTDTLVQYVICTVTD